MDLNDVTLRCGNNDTILSSIVDESVFCTDPQAMLVQFVLPAIIFVLIMLIGLVIILLNQKRILIW